MPYLLLLFVILTFYHPCCGQSESKWSLGIRAGLSKSVASDQLLNHYNYMGNSILNFTVEGAYHTTRHTFLLQLLGNGSKLYPNNENPLYYQYNSVQRTFAELRIVYLSRITKRQQQFNVYFGGCNAIIYVAQMQQQESRLYSSGLNHRKSYLFAPINIMPFLSMEYLRNKLVLNATAGYALVNLSARPNDSYVKQIHVDYERHWRLSLPDKFASLRYSIQSKYTIGTLGISLTYDGGFDEIREYQSLNHMIQAGINISI